MICRYLLRDILCAFALFPAMFSTAQTRIAVLSDIHVMSPKLVKGDGTAWKKALAKERKVLDYSHQAFDQMVEKYLTDKPNMLLITGDLTKDGELESHEYVVAGLGRLREAGIKVYVIPGNHDLGTDKALVFDGETTHKAEVAGETAFENLYRQFGYDGSSARETSSLTYACEPIQELRLIGIDSGKYGVLSNVTVDWVCQQARQARKEGKQVIAMMHHPLFPHVNGTDVFSTSFSVKDYENVRNRFVDAGIRVILTGHVHVSDIAKDYNAAITDSIYDVNTGSTISYPCDYREMTLDQDLSQLTIKTGHISSLPAKEDYMETAKTRLKDFVIHYANDFTNNEIYAKILAAMAIIHAEGNENHSAEAQSFIGLYDMGKSVLHTNSTLQSKLQAHGLTWEGVETALHSMLKDISSYGIKGRENQTNDLELTIDLR